MAARDSWRGAVEFAGFPIHVRLFNRRKSTRPSSGVHMCTATGERVRQVYLTVEGSKDKNEYSMGTLNRGLELAEDQPLKVLSDETLAAMKGAERTASAECEGFVRRESLSLDMAASTYNVIPDGNVAGSEGPVAQLAIGLRATNTAYVTKLTMRSGSGDTIIVLYVEGDVLRAAAIPFEADLTDAPEFKVEGDSKVEKMFKTMLDNVYEISDFDHSAFASDHAVNRDAILAKARAGETIEAPEVPEAKPDGPDLMAVLEAAAKDAEGKGKSKPKPRKRSKAKAAA